MKYCILWATPDLAAHLLTAIIHHHTKETPCFSVMSSSFLSNEPFVSFIRTGKSRPSSKYCFATILVNAVSRHMDCSDTTRTKTARYATNKFCESNFEAATTVTTVRTIQKESIKKKDSCMVHFSALWISPQH